jgi:ribose-phosphate pyrophosphokinase
MLVVTGPPGYWLVSAIASGLGGVEIPVYEKVFPDGELYVRLLNPEKVTNRSVVLVSTLYPDQGRILLRTLLIIDAIKQSNPGRVIGVIPYLAYSRQDKVFMPGEPISACVVVKALKNTGLDALLTVDVHSPRVLECFGDQAHNILVSDLMVGSALKYLENPIVLAPDKGALERTSFAARVHGLEHDYLEKKRDRVTGAVSYTPRELSVSGRDVVIVDDIISTGGTIAEATRILYKSGARRVVVAATHGLLVGEALRKLEEAGVFKLILADTLLVRYDHPLVEYVDVAPRIIEAIKEQLK